MCTYHKIKKLCMPPCCGGSGGGGGTSKGCYMAVELAG